ncbi:DMT family transporter [Hymenobacter chitinivorans]|uniref:EamA domain-containing membrane protein RarD n=1 Tax=Hymenobacter chitinivorans DSM 11115 TaxID=1121954 RepID=A0A2M9ASK0_9BACT|nr:DMT family transporter [Hymenobacter chitinivorans]PJJ48681.1 EamA domain-containing membrane protein RarD [Hymenobacter chitinivorans DSM 11115]
MPLTSGARYMLLSTLLFALMNVCVKLLGHLPPLEIILFRSIFSLAASYLLLRVLRIRPWGTNHFYLVSRGITGVLSLILYFFTLQKMPLATAVTIQYLAPIFTAVLGIFIVRESVRPWQWAFFLLSFLGVLVVEGVDTRVEPLYLALGVASALFAGFSYNSIRKLKGKEDPLVVVFYLPMVALPVAAVYCLFDWVPPRGLDWLWLLLTGLLAQGAQLCLTKAYQAERLSSVANLNYLGILYAVGLGLLFFNEAFPVVAYLGMALVLLGVVLNTWYTSRNPAAAPLAPTEEVAA